MKAFILGAGYGTRVLPLTESRPKPLIPVLGKPLISYAINHLKKYGIKQLVINLHHLSKSVRDALGNGKDYGVKIEYSFEPDILETGGGIKKAQKLIGNGTFIVYNCDIITDCNLTKLIDFHRRKKALATVALSAKYEPRTVVMDENRRIVEFRNKSPISNKYVFCGIHVIEPKIFNFLPLKKISIIDVYENLLKTGRGIFGYVIKNKWQDLGSIDHYVQVHENATRKATKGKNNAVAGGFRTSGFVSIGNNNVIGKNCVIKNSILWDNITLESGLKIENSIITDNSVVNKNLSWKIFADGKEHPIHK